MTSAQRLRLSHIATGHPSAPKPTAEDIRLLLAELDAVMEIATRCDYALDAALDVAAGEAFARTVPKRRLS